MELANLSLTLTSYVLGLVHGLDTDHVIDVTDFVSQDHRPSQALLFGSKFGIGHTITVLAAKLPNPKTQEGVVIPKTIKSRFIAPQRINPITIPAVQ